MVDKVRASRDGHEFHELWIARLALGLITHQDGLIGIAIEGVSPKEKLKNNKELVEIADAILFYGGAPTFELAQKSRIMQVKYSITSSKVDYRNSHAKKTVSKFAASYKKLVKQLGQEIVKSKITFEIITNRPIYPAFAAAIKLTAENKKTSGESQKQAEQFKRACGLKGNQLRHFAQLFILNGNEKNLPSNLKSLNRTISDWSSSNGASANARAGNLKQLIRSKAGSKGENDNLILETDILAELELESEEDLLPCPPFLKKIENVIRREHFDEIYHSIRLQADPILISAEGGGGKSVLLQSLQEALSCEYQTVIFDCFGGGAYRSPEDARHLPRKGLAHIVNTFACQSLCDPLIPADSATLDGLLKTFRNRMSQVVSAVRRNINKKGVVLFLDAIDNSQKAANDSEQDCFPLLLLESIQHSGKIDGLKIVSTCRTHRKPENFDHGFFREISLKPFSKEETINFLKARKPELSDSQINVAFIRSVGNPRILEHIVQSEDTILDNKNIGDQIDIDELIGTKIEDALSHAKLQGSTPKEIELFLTGLCVLPPPVPIGDYSIACAIPETAISSFASDLAPLLDRFGNGIVFRDEPTETFIREKFGTNNKILKSLTNNLESLQEQSAYAARALPQLLTILAEGERLYDLAFSKVFPLSVTSKVGIQRIRKARISSSLLLALKNSNYNQMLPLLIELSTVSTSNSRIQNYLAEYPELVFESNDPESVRSLLETRTPWPGSRFASSCVIQALSGELEESDRNRNRLLGWLRHHYSSETERERDAPEPTPLDAAAVAFSDFSQGKLTEAISYLRGWRHWYGHDVTTIIIRFLNHRDFDKNKVVKSLNDELGVMTSFIEHGELSIRQKIKLVQKLSKHCREKIDEIQASGNHDNQLNGFGNSLLHAAAFSILNKQNNCAKKILSVVSPGRYGSWTFDSRGGHSNYAKNYIFPFFLHTVLATTASNKPLDIKALLSRELFDECNQVVRGKNTQSYITRLKRRVNKFIVSDENVREDGQPKISKDQETTLYKHIDSDLTKLVSLAQAFAYAITCDNRTSLKALELFTDCCTQISSKTDQYGRNISNDQFTLLGFECVLFLISLRTSYKERHANQVIKWCEDQGVLTPFRRRSLAESMAKNSSMHEIAATQANLASEQISQTDSDIDTRASFFGSIAVILKKIDSGEAIHHFKKGLVQLDSLGSGDFEYISQLLNLIGSMKLEEMEPDTFHILSNLVEINMYEPEKFGWYSFSNAFSNIAGLRMIAKLARWHDRSTANLGITLLPYLTALLDRKKISPEIAIALNTLSDPYELYVCNSEHFIDQIASESCQHTELYIEAALQQYLASNPTLGIHRTLKSIIEKHKDSLDKPLYVHLSKVVRKLGSISQARYKREEAERYRPYVRNIEKKDSGLPSVKTLSKNAAPLTVESVQKSIETISKMPDSRTATTKFFELLRARVRYAERYEYLETVASLTCIDIYQKLEELDDCLNLWSSSSSSLSNNRKKLLNPILEHNLDDMFSWNSISHSNVAKVSSITAIAKEQLAVKIALIFIEKNIELSGAEWLGIAELIVNETSIDVASDRLNAIMSSNSNSLASTLHEQASPKEYYPKNDEVQVSANLIFSQLGAPAHKERWHASHSIRYLARFERWDVIEHLIQLYKSGHIPCFGSEELKVYTLHSRLWLLIGLSRVALEFPKNVAKYREFLFSIISDSNYPHSLLHHFAAATLISCMNAGFVKFPKNKTDRIFAAGSSTFKPLNAYDDEVRNLRYVSRRNGYKHPEKYFHLSYEFQKYEVESLSRTFGIPKWKIEDAISKNVLQKDLGVRYQSDSGGREFYHRRENREHTYGDYLAWHAIHEVSADLLGSTPILKDEYDLKDRWQRWLEGFCLSRDDFLWPSDGIDIMPSDIPIELLEHKPNFSTITGKREMLLSLICQHDSGIGGFVIDGYWHSRDNVTVRISSALVDSGIRKSMSKKLSQENCFNVYLPNIEVYEGVEQRPSYSEKIGYEPWICRQESEERLDADDPYGDRVTHQRSLFSESFSSMLKVRPDDPFSRIWVNKAGRKVGISQAWMGRRDDYGESHSMSGSRLIVSNTALKKFLKLSKKKVVILIGLTRYVKDGDEKGHYTTTATCSIDEDLKIIFHRGAVNEKLVII